MSGKPRDDLMPVRVWLRQALALRLRLEEAVQREQLLERTQGVSEALEAAREQQRMATDRWARRWAARAKAIDAVPDGRWAAVLGYEYLQGLRRGQIMGILDCNIKTVQEWDLRGCEWIKTHVNIKKEPR